MQMQLSETPTMTTPIITKKPVADRGEGGQKQQRPIAALIIFSVLFYAVWVLFELGVKPYLNSLDADPVPMQFLKSGVIKNLCWTLPALLLVKKYDRQVHIPLKEMFTAEFDGRIALWVFGACTAVVLIPKIFLHGSFELNPEFRAVTLIGYLFVGITEESVFRGWLLNAMAGRDDSPKSKWTALIISSVMFMFIHFPTWYTSGVLSSNILTGRGFGIIPIGIVFGWLFLHTKNLMLVVMLHMYYDVLISLFV